MIAGPNPEQEAGATLTPEFEVKGVIESSKPVADGVHHDHAAELTQLPEVPRASAGWIGRETNDFLQDRIALCRQSVPQMRVALREQTVPAPEQGADK